MRIILASGSPRRKMIMQKLFGDNFAVKESDYEEDNNLDISPVELVKLHSKGKARDIKEDGLIIAADSVVVYENKVIGKPKDKRDAINILKKINGKEIQVITGITITDKKKEITECEKTVLKIQDLTTEEIKKYVDSGEPMGRAGAFAADGFGGSFIEYINGCHYNIVGLPMYKLRKMLKNFDVDLFCSGNF